MKLPSGRGVGVWLLSALRPSAIAAVISALEIIRLAGLFTLNVANTAGHVIGRMEV